MQKTLQREVSVEDASDDHVSALAQALELSVVVPAYNEEENLEAIVAALHRNLGVMTQSYEIVIVNDGSRDRTADSLAKIAAADTRVVAINLSRNFGKEAAMCAGMERARGRCLAFIDADLQHPPELLQRMLNEWRSGADVVNAVKRARGDESLVYKLFAHFFNRAMSAAIGVEVGGASDYKLIDRQVAEALAQCQERSRFFRGLVAWVGFNVVDVPFDVNERIAGRSKWSPMALVRYSLRNVLAFSSFPLLAVAYAGFFVVVIGIFLLGQTLYNFYHGAALAGFTTVIALQILLSGMILFSLGIIAVYIAKIYEEQKFRPIYLVSQGRGERRQS